MTATLLPRCVSANADFPIYYFRTSANDITGLRYVPLLPENSGWRWAEDAEVAAPHIVLTQTVVAELLFLAKGEPSTLSDAAAVSAIDYVLAMNHCDLKRCVAAIALEYGESWATAAAARMSRCVTRAARLVGTEA
jgi:hypothetical protein